jgi:monoamine oxidase
LGGIGLPPPRIVIVGAGIAGLAAALTLQDAGHESTLVEAAERPGGRMRSDDTTWDEGQVTETCGELIDSDHDTIRGLAKRFGLPLVDLHAAEPPEATDTYHLGGGYYRSADMAADLAPVLAAAAADLDAAGYPATFLSHTSFARELDRCSVRNWIDAHVEGGHRSRLGCLLDVAYRGEFGCDTREQSALNLVFMLGSGGDGETAIHGSSDERFRIAGGNGRLPLALADHLAAGSPPCRIELSTTLARIASGVDGTYRLRVVSGDESRELLADHVVLTLPFSVLRGVDSAKAGFSEVKRTAIEQLGYGAHRKLHLQFRHRLWSRRGPWGVSTGGSYSDAPYQCTWDSTRGQQGEAGILTVFTAIDRGGAEQDAGAAARAVLPQLERVWPGIAAEWNGRATLSAPAVDPRLRGSYSCWLRGQCTSFGGAEGTREGNCHFAGEHTSIDYQGFMEGAAAEGIRAAREVLADHDAGRHP